MALLTLFGSSHYTPVEHHLEERAGFVAFGSLEVDLTHMPLAPGDHELELLVLFGSATIRVPEDMAVRLDGIALFGGMSNRKPVPFEQASVRLAVRVLCAFGGVNVKRSAAHTSIEGIEDSEGSYEQVDERPLLDTARADEAYDGPTRRLKDPLAL